MNDAPDRFDVLAELGPLRRYAGSLSRGGEEAEDLVHDTLVRALERRSTFRHGRNLRVWLLSILHNCFVDRLRRQRSQAAGALHPDPAETFAPAGQEHAVRLAEVRAAFLGLPDEQRATLHLVAIEGLTYAEAAASLGVPVGTVMSRLARARATLRALEDGPPQAGSVSHLRIVGGSDEPSR